MSPLKVKRGAREMVKRNLPPGPLVPESASRKRRELTDESCSGFTCSGACHEHPWAGCRPQQQPSQPTPVLSQSKIKVGWKECQGSNPGLFHRPVLYCNLGPFSFKI